MGFPVSLLDLEVVATMARNDGFLFFFSTFCSARENSLKEILYHGYNGNKNNFISGKTLEDWVIFSIN